MLIHTSAGPQAMPQQKLPYKTIRQLINRAAQTEGAQWAWALLPDGRVYHAYKKTQQLKIKIGTAARIKTRTILVSNHGPLPEKILSELNSLGQSIYEIEKVQLVQQQIKKEKDSPFIEGLQIIEMQDI